MAAGWGSWSCSPMCPPLPLHLTPRRHGHSGAHQPAAACPGRIRASGEWKAARWAAGAPWHTTPRLESPHRLPVTVNAPNGSPVVGTWGWAPSVAEGPPTAAMAEPWRVEAARRDARFPWMPSHPVPVSVSVSQAVAEICWLSHASQATSLPRIQGPFHTSPGHSLIMKRPPPTPPVMKVHSALADLALHPWASTAAALIGTIPSGPRSPPPASRAVPAPGSRPPIHAPGRSPPCEGPATITCQQNPAARIEAAASPSDATFIPRMERFVISSLRPSHICATRRRAASKSPYRGTPPDFCAHAPVKRHGLCWLRHLETPRRDNERRPL
ncbi:hypothetical protein Purlil1_2943 [Purpureocillium lilacinum]|uniref:Uncharacterized protein n=1 Tax=Purpureocillium lilacinum TaxID=33203 RepID=A0ABR0CBA3_PURLI|nr:hypothetical protein Purlil1_2943 [Purpureocillium lilacinum]